MGPLSAKYRAVLRVRSNVHIMLYVQYRSPWIRPRTTIMIDARYATLRVRSFVLISVIWCTMLLVYLGCDHTSPPPDSFVVNVMLARSSPDTLSTLNSWLVSFPEPSNLRQVSHWAGIHLTRAPAWV